MMASEVDDNRGIQNEVCESGLGSHKVADADLDNDGRPRRTGSLWTACALVITAVIGAGVLSLAWSLAQIGWVGVLVLIIFGIITFYTSNLLAECYRCPVTGKRNYTYMQAVKANLGGKMYMACGLAQYSLLIGLAIGYTITAAISMVAIQKSNCFHKRGHEAPCEVSHKPYMIGMGLFEIVVSQIPDIGEMWGLSVIATVTSFGYASIGAALAFSTVISGHGKRTSVTGVEVGPGITAAQKMWRMFRAIGDMLLCSSYSAILIEIQDTLKSSGSEIQVMKKANMISVSTTTLFYLICACFGYAAFGNNAHGNMLTGFGFYEPFWLIDLANTFIVMHLVGAYQVVSQPVFGAVESQMRRWWPRSKFVIAEYPIRIGKKNFNMSINLLRLTWRIMFVVIITLLALALPYFNEVLALLGAISFWPLTVYFPVNMYIVQKKISRWTIRWFGLQSLNFVCLLVALAAACGSIEGFAEALHIFKHS
ncbi:amino acid permease 1-like [Vitis riparia]|uniref:amino acid permease 1-like n=1 Tax=Vitis riparia TaxID=96939 RepID=UPI00155B39B2|nr:amino acid permease 1-like [Vitis riparia]